MSRVTSPSAMSERNGINGGKDHEQNGREDGAVVSEPEAIHMLRGFNIKPESLRKYAQSKNAVEKKKTQHLYSRNLIHDLSNNYFMKKEAMRLLKYKKSGLYYWIRPIGICFPEAPGQHVCWAT